MRAGENTDEEGRRQYREDMMQSGEKLRAVLAALLIVLSFVLRVVAPRINLFVGLGSRFYRAASIASWLFLVAGLIAGMLVVFNVLARGQNMR